jgi:hypothetical protein
MDRLALLGRSFAFLFFFIARSQAWSVCNLTGLNEGEYPNYPEPAAHASTHPTANLPEAPLRPGGFRFSDIDKGEVTGMQLTNLANHYYDTLVGKDNVLRSAFQDRFDAVFDAFAAKAATKKINEDFSAHLQNLQEVGRLPLKEEQRRILEERIKFWKERIQTAQALGMHEELTGFHEQPADTIALQPVQELYAALAEMDGTRPNSKIGIGIYDIILDTHTSEDASVKATFLALAFNSLTQIKSMDPVEWENLSDAYIVAYGRTLPSYEAYLRNPDLKGLDRVIAEKTYRRLIHDWHPIYLPESPKP